MDGLFITAQALKDKRQPSTAGSSSYDGVHRLNGNGADIPKLYCTWQYQHRDCWLYNGQHLST